MKKGCLYKSVKLVFKSVLMPRLSNVYLIPDCHANYHSLPLSVGIGSRVTMNGGALCDTEISLVSVSVPLLGSSGVEFW